MLITARATNAIVAQNRPVKPPGPPNFNQTIKGLVNSKSPSPTAPIRLKKVSSGHQVAR